MFLNHLAIGIENKEEDQDPCANNFCGPFSNQRNIGSQCQCSCLPGYIGSPPGCRPECIVSSDCPQNKACLNQKCTDPCDGRCGLSSRCTVISHHPICSCPPNFEGDPFVSCTKKDPRPEITVPPLPVHPCYPSPCGPNAACKPLGDTPMCSCVPGYKGAPPNCRPECVINDECSKSQACVNNKCVDPCSGACGVDAECSVRNHLAVCKCRAGYQGDPFRRCTKVPPPVQPVEAPQDPCYPSPCGANTDCKSNRRGFGGAARATCLCVKGYFGDPYGSGGCRPECTTNTDCPANLACSNDLKCVDPCRNVCGLEAKCQVVNHIATCTCRPGFQGDPFTQCTQIPGIWPRTFCAFKITLTYTHTHMYISAAS